MASPRVGKRRSRSREISENKRENRLFLRCHFFLRAKIFAEEMDGHTCHTKKTEATEKSYTKEMAKKRTNWFNESRVSSVSSLFIGTRLKEVGKIFFPSEIGRERN